MLNINRSLMNSTRHTSRKAMEDLSTGIKKTGKQQVRETTQKFTQKSVENRSAQLAKFVAEEGKGGSLQTSM